MLILSFWSAKIILRLISRHGCLIFVYYCRPCKNALKPAWKIFNRKIPARVLPRLTSQTKAPSEHFSGTFRMNPVVHGNSIVLDSATLFHRITIFNPVANGIRAFPFFSLRHSLDKLLLYIFVKYLHSFSKGYGAGIRRACPSFAE